MLGALALDCRSGLLTREDEREELCTYIASAFPRKSPRVHETFQILIVVIVHGGCKIVVKDKLYKCAKSTWLTRPIYYEVICLDVILQ